MRVVAFTGMPGAGKSEAVEVARARGIPVVRMGDLVWEEVRRRGLALDPEIVGRVATEVRQKEGMDAFAARTCRRIRDKHADAPLVVVDGVRNWEEVERMRRELGEDFHLVAVTSAPETRSDRLRSRGRPDDPTQHEQVAARDEREMGWGIARAIAMADAVLTNEGALPEFRQRVTVYLDSVTESS